jgi:2-hydroxychromene-2-carboxylate isomerase
MRIRTLVLSACLLALIAGLSVPARSQILMVTGEYQVVTVDRANQRIGVALREDDPNTRQNWVYVRPDTRIVHRVWTGNEFRDENLSFNQFFDSIRHGDKLRTTGGRDWNGTIKATKIWL